MSWSRKEKELTPEEAIRRAKEELADSWFGSTPLICGVKSDEGYQALPLDPLVTKGTWLFFFSDPTDESGPIALKYLRQFERRYEALGVRIVCVLKQAYLYLAQKRAVEQFRKKYHLTSVIVLDADWSLAHSFGDEALPMMALIHDGQLIFARAGKKWMQGSELELQASLRRNDPGLPLPTPYVPEGGFSWPLGRIEFGSASGFDLKAPRVSMSGAWTQDEEKITTSDPAASIGFESTGGGVSIVAQSITKELDPGSISVEFAGNPVLEENLSANVTRDDEGRAIIKVDVPALYVAAVKLPYDRRKITLKFPSAKRIPVAVYGVRFSES